MDEVEAAMAVAKDGHAPLLLMQCNTEYTAKVGDSRAQQLERFRHINLRVLETYSKRWPDVPVGLSDHTHGDLTVLGAVGMYGCSAVEKHFTLDNRLDGQDHAFSMTPTGWLKMVRETAALKTALEGVSSAEDRYRVTAARVKDPEALALAIGDGVKRIEANELGPAIVQRRSIRARTDLAVGRVLTRDDLVVLRPCPAGSLPPYRLPDIVGHTLLRALRAEEHITESDLG
jgi:N-acetylneuraminate synthase